MFTIHKLYFTLQIILLLKGHFKLEIFYFFTESPMSPTRTNNACHVSSLQREIGICRCYTFCRSSAAIAINQEGDNAGRARDINVTHDRVNEECD